MESVQTNIVVFKLPKEEDVARFCAALQARGVLARGAGLRTVRFVTHFDVSRQACERAAQVVAEVLADWE